MTNFAVPLVILMWNRMLQEHFLTGSDDTFFDLGDYCEQKKKNKDTPYDNMSMSPNNGNETKVQSFGCFQPNKTLESSPKVCTSQILWGAQ